MAAQTLSEIEFYQWMNESLVRLESQLQAIFNEFRSLRTALETPQTQNSSPPSPPPVSVTASPVLAAKPLTISATAQPPITQPPPVVASASQPLTAGPSLKPASKTSATQKQATRIALLPPKSAPFTATKLTTPPTSYPLEDTFIRDLKISYEASLHPKFMHVVISYGVRQIAISFLKKNVFFHLPGEDVNNRMVHHLGKDFKRRTTTKREAEKREWRPPWQPNKTVPNATTRTDWRPPWLSIFRLHILEDKDCSSGRD
ncbi:hypothetical protein HanRHA438_Chr06g0257711 [Helianthus annuus]|nr:hypothetical protein HanIR_Chr06g0267471 [Helianthus annuus]KAJ0910935.1 hypothetical protein HanRHA438_Chr06g0257711 [Helianthus annuus]